jgi:hypothetical protein
MGIQQGYYGRGGHSAIWIILLLVVLFLVFGILATR